MAHRRRDRLTATVARDELRSLGVHDDICGWVGRSARSPGRRAPRKYRVHVLGQFGVELGGEALPASVWPSRKARDVLRVLAVGVTGASAASGSEPSWLAGRQRGRQPTLRGALARPLG